MRHLSGSPCTAPHPKAGLENLLSVLPWLAPRSRFPQMPEEGVTWAADRPQLLLLSGMGAQGLWCVLDPPTSESLACPVRGVGAAEPGAGTCMLQPLTRGVDTGMAPASAYVGGKEATAQEGTPLCAGSLGSSLAFVLRLCAPQHHIQAWALP